MNVYRGMPFQPGERATYELGFMGVRAGFGTFEVGKPSNNGGDWYRVFRVEARTGKWYKPVYEGHGYVFAMSRPHDFGGRWFLLERSGRRFLSERKTKRHTLEFKQAHCKVVEHIIETGKQEKIEEKDAPVEAMDVLSAAYFIRAHRFQIGKTERAPLYHSGKNYSVRVHPESYEEVTVPAGTFRTIKLRGQSYLNGEPQDKGILRIWLAEDHPNRPIVLVDAQVKLGHVTLRLQSYHPGEKAGQAGNDSPNLTAR